MPVAILHGWSDTARSFRGLAEVIRQGLGDTPVRVRLADWISLHDDVTVPDLAAAMERAWRAAAMPIAPRSADLVVHSTGALVAREWMTRYYTPETVPVRRLVMLAPANFGSGLAHKGHSFIARAVKGWGNGFQTGAGILRALEIASPYTAALADRDLFGGKRWYGRGGVLATVLIGNEGYDGVRSIANEPGSDGTVRFATANLNALRVDLVVGSTPGTVASVRTLRARGATAFAIVPGHDHGSIRQKGKGAPAALRDQLLLEALRVTDADYPDHEGPGGVFPWQARLDRHTAGVQAATLQNTVVHLADDCGHDVTDFFVEFYREPRKPDKRFEQSFYSSVIRHVHVYKPNPAWRGLYLDTGRLHAYNQGDRPALPQLYLSVAATPEFAPPRKPVGYSSFATGSHVGELRIPAERLGHYFAAHRTLILRTVIPRQVDERIFAFGA